MTRAKKTAATVAALLAAGVAVTVLTPNATAVECDMLTEKGTYETVRFRGMDAGIDMQRVATCRTVEASVKEPTVVEPPCACSAGPDCRVGRKAAPRGVTLEAGTFKGKSCIPKVCVEVAGTSSWPSGCDE